jgi:hypothetical protein
MRIKGKSIKVFVTHNMMSNQKKINICNTVFVGLDTFLGKESESKTHVEENESKICMNIYAIE